MTYLLFLVLFVVPPMLYFGSQMRERLTQRLLLVLGALVFAAVAYTTPWDNYLVATRVWYYDPGLVVNFVIGYVPIEEYTFFILQTLMTGFFALWLWRRMYPQDWE